MTAMETISASLTEVSEATGSDVEPKLGRLGSGVMDDDGDTACCFPVAIILISRTAVPM